MEEIPMTELWFVDITKYVYDSLATYIPLLEKWMQKVIVRTWSVAKEPRPFIAFSSIWWPISNWLWIRGELFQIEIYSWSFEEWEKIRDIVVDLFNRRNFKWIRSELTRAGPNWSNEETWFSRHVLDFNFVFKDMKY